MQSLGSDFLGFRSSVGWNDLKLLSPKKWLEGAEHLGEFSNCSILLALCLEQDGGEKNLDSSQVFPIIVEWSSCRSMQKVLFPRC